MTPPRPPWFVELIRAMTAAPTTLAGVVHARIHDGGGTEFRYRVQRRGGLFRVCDTAGNVYAVAGPHTGWLLADDGRLVAYRHRGRAHVPDDYEFGVLPEDDDRWTGADFTMPLGEPSEVTVLGRPAWRIDLAPPPHKPSPMYLVVDRATGTVLERGNDAFGTFARWDELDLDPDLADALFALQPTDRPARPLEP